MTASHRFARQLGMGLDGLAMLALSNLVLLATGGLSGLWLLRQVWRVARTAPATDDGGGWIVVLGVRLRRDQIRPDYALRLHRAAALYRASPDRRILLVGGYTGSRLSEAAHGRQFLIEAGLPAAHLFIEDRSLHTLDNLRQARQLLASFWQQWFLTTLGHAPAIPLEHTAATLARQNPELAKALQGAARNLALFTVRLPAGAKDFTRAFNQQWQETPQLVHPLAGYAQMHLQNANGSLAARGTVLQWVERLTSLWEQS